MRILYMGTPDFAVNPLKKIIEAGYDVCGVVCNHDKPVGRKHILTPPSVKVCGLENHLNICQYSKIRLEGVDDIKKLNPDIIVTCAFGQILSQEIIDIPKYGVINIHASLLPKYRGASPIHFAILNGEKKTGVTIMRTDAGIDTGDIITQREIDIKEDETCGELFDRLSVLGSEMIVDVLKDIENGTVRYIKQDNSKATLTKIIKKEMAQIDFNNKSTDIINQIRAFNPSPIAFTCLENQPFKIYKAIKSNLTGEPGTILKCDDELVIGCGEGAISLVKVQKSGGKPMNIKDFLCGNKFNLGDKFI